MTVAPEDEPRGRNPEATILLALRQRRERTIGRHRDADDAWLDEEIQSVSASPPASRRSG